MLIDAQNRLPAVAKMDSDFISRVFTDRNGKMFRLTFLVAIVNGELKGRLVSVQQISHSEPISYDQPTICLPITCEDKKPNTVYVSTYAPVKSPYFSVEFLLNTQPARAPSFV